MGYDGKINRKLRTVELNDDEECLYKLAYDEEKRSCFSREDILKYVNDYYLKNDNISDNINDNMFEENLLNDLNTFKTYRDDVDSLVRNKGSQSNYLAILIAISGILFNIIEDYKCIRLIVSFIVLLMFLIFMGYIFSNSKNSELEKLKYIINAIYTLETIKEDMYRNGSSGTESDERYDGLELTEVKEIRTYKAKKNKYSPRAMHHRKRR